MNLIFLFFFIFASKFNHLDAKAHCDYQYIKLTLEWPHTRFTATDPNYAWRDLSPLFIIKRINAMYFDPKEYGDMFPPLEFDHQESECVSGDVDTFRDEVNREIETFYPDVHNQGAPDYSFWANKYIRHSVCAYSTRNLRTPAEFYNFFVSEALHFNDHFFESLFTTSLSDVQQESLTPNFHTTDLWNDYREPEEEREEQPTDYEMVCTEHARKIRPGDDPNQTYQASDFLTARFIKCNLLAFRKKLLSTYQAKVYLSCRFGNLKYRHPNADRYQLNLEKYFILENVHMCYSRDANLIDCVVGEEDDTCGYEPGTYIIFPSNYENFEIEEI